jgi:hypothetical protein
MSVKTCSDCGGILVKIDRPFLGTKKRTVCPTCLQDRQDSIITLLSPGVHNPKIVCLCGSTRFSEAFQKANLTETLAGRIVLTIGFDMRSDAALFEGWGVREVEAIKARLDELHLRKIDLANEILVLNVGGYIGESTRREIEYARSIGKKVRWLEMADTDSLEQ